MKKVVIVDDEYIVVNGIKAMIAREKMDFEVTGYACDGIEGLKVIIEQQPDLVISDIRMPGMDGLALIEEARAYLPETIFVIISGYQEFEYARRALSLGVRGYIDKPITMAKVRETLQMANELIEKRQHSRNDALKKEYQTVSGQLMGLITERKSEGYVPLLDHALEMLKGLAPELDDYKEECYKLICLGFGMFYEHRQEKKEEQHFPSHNNMIRLETMEDVDSVVHELFKSMFQKIHAENLGNIHSTIIKLLEYIDDNYQRDMGLAEIADNFEMNPAYLSILFKEQVGMSYIKYLTKVRMDHAKRLLLEGYKVGEVSEMVGYSNYRYFCDVFKKHEGQTPNEFKGVVRKK